MERYGVDRERSFLMLTVLSQQTNRKLRVIAEQIAGQIPAGAGRQHRASGSVNLQD